MKSMFTSLYGSILDTTFNSWIVPEAGLAEGLKELFKGWDQSFHKLLKDIERMSDRRRRGADQQKKIELEKKAVQREVEEDPSLDEQRLFFDKIRARLAISNLPYLHVQPVF
jgi:hypothetical protein